MSYNPSAGAGGGDVSVTGTPVAQDIAYWTDATTIRGTDSAGNGADFQWTPATESVFLVKSTNGPQFTIEGGQPQVRFEEPESADDQANWMLIANNEAFFGQIYDDAYANSANWLEINRSGTGASVTVDSINLTATSVLINGSAVGTGDVTKVGTPANDQIGVWTGDGTIEGSASFKFSETTDLLTVGDGTYTAPRIALVGAVTTSEPQIDFTQFSTVKANIHWDNAATELQVVSSAGLRLGTYLSVSSAGNVTAERDLQVGDSGNAQCLVNLDCSTVGDVLMNFRQNSVVKAFIQYDDTGDIFKIDADTDIEISIGGTTEISIGASGEIITPNLPTADPSVAGQWWNNSGVLTISAG